MFIDLLDESLMNTNVSELRFVAWDTETTGINAEQCHVVEIAACAFDEEFVHRRFETLVRPPKSIPADVIKIHGIDDQMVAHAPPTQEALELFSDFLTHSGSPRVLVAHNCGFDISFIHNEAKRTAYKGFAQTEIVLDSCNLARALLPELEKHSLSALTAHLKVSAPENFHRAAADVHALHGVFMALLSLAADKTLGQGDELTLGSLIDLACGYHVLDPKNDAVSKQSFQLSNRLKQLEAVCGTDVRVGIVYDKEETGLRYITPLRMRKKSSRIYVDALCHEQNIKKTFRADRILKVVVR